jgi:hypothetical protein
MLAYSLAQIPGVLGVTNALKTDREEESAPVMGLTS